MRPPTCMGSLRRVSPIAKCGWRPPSLRLARRGLQRRGGGGFFCNSFKFHRFDEAMGVAALGNDPARELGMQEVPEKRESIGDG